MRTELKVLHRKELFFMSAALAVASVASAFHAWKIKDMALLLSSLFGIVFGIGFVIFTAPRRKRPE